MKYLITPQKIIDLAFSQSDQITDDAIKETKIDAAQEQFLRPVLGGALYKTLFDGKYNALLTEYIQPALAYYVRYTMIPDLALKLNNSGVQVFGAMHSSAATDKQRAEIRQQAKEDATALLDKTIRYIETHKKEFPEYDPQVNIRKHVISNAGIILT